MVHSSVSTRRLLALGFIGPILTVGTFILDGATRPAYSPFRHTVSQLSLGDRGWLGTANLIIGGLLLLGFSVGLWRVVPRSPSGIWGRRLVAVIGASMFAAGLFPTDAGLGYPAAAASTVTVHGLLHAAAGLVLFSSLSAAFFIFTPRAALDNPWAGTKAYGLIGGTISAVAVIGCIATQSLDLQGRGPACAGLLERIAIIVGYSGIMFLAWTYRRPVPATEEISA